jgi:(E)-4-hydroxy-3-methyl-but-2-enyl pyrophosphate reductase
VETPVPTLEDRNAEAKTLEDLEMPEEGAVGKSMHAGSTVGENGLTIVVAQTAGFCYGVKRAVEMAWKAVDQSVQLGKKAATLGPVIHNPQEVERLEKRNVFAQEGFDGLGAGDLIVIRAHGIPKGDSARAKDSGITVLDATCPYVRRPQMLAERAARDGYLVVIVGDPNHPEIKGVRSYAGDRGAVVRDASEVASLPPAKKVAILVQTTQKHEVFQAVVDACIARGYAEVKPMNTICDDTTERQADVKSVAADVDVMLVVGGKMSANTSKLADIASQYTKRTHLIERAEEIDPQWFDGCTRVGVAAGASTPDWLVAEIVKVVGAKRADAALHG